MGKKNPTLSYLQTFGCLAKVNLSINKKHKLRPKTMDCVFLGYASHYIAYIFVLVKSGVDDMSVGTIFESRDATFFEDIFPARDMPSMSSWESDPLSELDTPIEFSEKSDDESSDSREDKNEAPIRSKRQRTSMSFGNDFIVYHFRSSCISGCRLLEGSSSKRD
jgi:hypothetical protein